MLKSWRKNRITVSLGLSTPLLLLSLNSAANEEDDLLASISLEQLLDIEVVTASRSKESASSAPGTIVVIPQQQIKDRGYRHLEDVLRDLPGVENQKATDPVPYNRMTIRGVQGNSKFVILQNGVRISSPTGEEVPINSNFPLYHVKQIEIVFGPASALYGADAFTGVINLITYTNADEVDNQASISGGSEGYFNGQFMTGFTFGEHTQVVLGAHITRDDHIDYTRQYPNDYAINDLQDFGGFTVLAKDQRTRPEFATESHHIYLSAQYGENLKFGLNHSSFENSTGLSTRPDFIDFHPSSVWQTELGALYASYHLEINEHISTDIQASYSRYEVDPTTRFRNIFVNYQDGFKYAKGSELEFGQQFHITLGENSDMITGYVFERFTSTPKTGDLPIPYDTGRSASNQQLYYLGTDGALPLEIFSIKYESVGAFAQLKHRWSDTLTTVAGVRYDDSTSYGSTVNPRAGLVWTPEEKWTVKLLFGEAFLAPAPKAAYENFGSFFPEPDENGIYQSGFFHVPNPQLQPEEMQTLELNVNFRATDNLNLTFTTYAEKVDNLIMIAPVFPAVSDFVAGGNIAFTQSNQNIGELKASGFDTGFIFQSQVLEGTVQLFGNYSYVDGELNSPGVTTDLPFTANNKLKLGATYRQGDFYITPTYYYFSKTHGSEVGANIGQQVEDYSLFNLVAGIDNVLENLDMSLRIDNVSDKQYYNAGLGDFDFFSVPQETRRYSLTFKYRF